MSAQPNTERKPLNVRRHDALLGENRSFAPHMSPGPNQHPQPIPPTADQTQALASQPQQGQPGRAPSFTTQRPQAFKPTSAGIQQPSALPRPGGFGSTPPVHQRSTTTARGLNTLTNGRLHQEEPVQLQAMGARQTPHGKMQGAALGRFSSARIETLDEDTEAEYAGYEERSEPAQKAPVIKLPPFQINHQFGDHLHFIGSLAQTPVWNKSIETAKRLEFGANIDEKAISALMEKHAKSVERMMSELAKMTESCKQLEKLKDDTLGEKKYMTERYVEAGKVLSEQCNALQVSTRSIQGPKRRRITGAYMREGIASQEY